MVTQSDTEGLFLYESIKLCGKYSDASLITVLSIHRVERTLAERGRSRRKREREKEREIEKGEYIEESKIRKERMW